MRGVCFTLSAAAVLAAAGGETLSGDELWGGRKAHPALVNQVMAVPGDPNTVSMRGEWDFLATLSKNARNTPWSTAFKGKGSFWKDVRKIRVPGCWEAQLADDNVTTGRPWFCRWDCSPLLIRGYHSGDGWYRREVSLPAAWKGRRVWLKTGWVNSQGWFWINGHQVAMDRNCCATYKYEVTDLVKFDAPNMVVVQVNNALPSHRGCVNSKNHWGGILRDIEFESTPGTYIDDAWVRGDFGARAAEVHVEVGGIVSCEGYSLRVAVEGESLETALGPQTEQTVRLPLAVFRPWSPEHPNLYTARVDLVEGGKIVQTRYERFGVRKLETRGRAVFLNDRPIELRGAGWHAIDPINGYTLPDRKAWLARARQIRAAGFNIVRNHTECKMPEFFEACDEAGLMVQPELPYYGDVASDGQRFDPPADAEMLYRHYRRHPSFAIYSFGNEGGFGPYLSRRLYAEVKRRDPDRLVVGQDGGDGTWNPTNYRGTSDFAGAPIRVIRRGSYKPELPYFYHEFINSSVKLDSRVADGFTGVWAAPISRKARAEFLAPFGLDMEWGDRLQNGQNRMQKIYLKYGIESARLDFNACGYSYWSLQDACSPQGGTFIGQALWDPFWNEKRCGTSGKELAVFNSPRCVLMTDGCDRQEYEPGTGGGFLLDSTVTNLVRRTGEQIKAIFHFVNHGEADMPGASLAWKLSADGRTLKSGEAALGDIALGGVRRIAAADIGIPSLDKAVRATLSADVSGVTNSWTYWLFPERRTRDGSRILCDAAFHAALAPRYPGLQKAASAATGDALSRCAVVIAARDGDLEKAAVKAGKTVISLANQTGPANITLGWWYMTEQMGAALKDHPMTALLPHNGLFEQLLFRIGKTGLKLPVEGFGRDDYVMVGEGGLGCYLYLAARTAPGGARQYLIAGMDVLSDTPEGTAILDATLQDAGGFAR